MTKQPTYQELQSELAEARALIEAIKDGEVDAILAKNQVLLFRLRESEEALRRSEEEKSLILAHTLEPIAHYDQQRQLKWVNRAYLQACGGLELGNVQGRKCFELRCRGKTCETSCPIARVLATGDPQQGELTFGQRPGGGLGAGLLAGERDPPDGRRGKSGRGDRSRARRQRQQASAE